MKQHSIIAIGADHRGFALKSFLMQQKVSEQSVWLDCGTFDSQRTDYPLFAYKVVQALLQGHASYGVLLCGTGVGMSIMANRFDRIYAGIAWNAEIALRNKQEDNINVLIIPADYCDQQESLVIVQTWLPASFKGGHYAQRLSLIDTLPKEDRHSDDPR